MSCLDILALPRESAEISVEEKLFYTEELIRVAIEAMRPGNEVTFNGNVWEGTMLRELQPLIKGFVSVVDSNSFILCSNIYIQVRLVSQLLRVTHMWY
jgi:hypothetical protein